MSEIVQTSVQLPAGPSPAAQAPTDALTVGQRDALAARLQAAWKALPPETQRALQPTLEEGHSQLSALVTTGTPPTHHSQMTLRLKSYLTNDWELCLAALGHPMNLAASQPLAAPLPARASEVSTSADGAIIGFGPYQQLDPRWELVAGTVWLEHLFFKHPFPPGMPAAPVPLPDNASIALISDWGTGNFGAGDAPAVKIAKFLSQPANVPQFSIHLGDTYYAGQSHEEQSHLLNLWPKGSVGSFALNANHEMYSGGGPYFDQVVGGPVFNKLQSPWSFFALEHSHWMVIGLDSAYFADARTLYLNGTLGENNTQTAFLTKMAGYAAGKKKPVILLTHHNPIEISGFDPDKQLQLYDDVANAFGRFPPPAYWYFGHEHVGAAFDPAKNANIRFRCLGHGGLPWGQSSILATAQANGVVEWYESRNAGDPNDRLRVLNGFVVLHLDGPVLRETYYDEDGNIAWQSTT